MLKIFSLAPPALAVIRNDSYRGRAQKMCVHQSVILLLFKLS